MSAINDVAEQLFCLSALSDDGHVTARQAAFLKWRILNGDAALADCCARAGAAPDDEADAAQAELGAQLRALAALDQQRVYEASFEFLEEEEAKHASRAEREALGLLEETTLVYGEIMFESFSRVLEFIDPKPGSVFLDLGSGSGRPCIAAALLAPFKRVVGIELLAGLHSLSRRAADAFTQAAEDAGMLPRDVPSISFIHGSFTDVPWGDVDVVFANSTCFDDDLMSAIAERAVALRPGACIITFTRRPEHAKLRPVFGRKMQQSWGEATVYVSQVLTDAQAAAEDGAAADWSGNVSVVMEETADEGDGEEEQQPLQKEAAPATGAPQQQRGLPVQLDDVLQERVSIAREHARSLLAAAVTSRFLSDWDDAVVSPSRSAESSSSQHNRGASADSSADDGAHGRGGGDRGSVSSASSSSAFRRVSARGSSQRGGAEAAHSPSHDAASAQSMSPRSQIVDGQFRPDSATAPSPAGYDAYVSPRSASADTGQHAGAPHEYAGVNDDAAAVRAMGGDVTYTNDAPSLESARVSVESSGFPAPARDAAVHVGAVATREPSPDAISSPFGSALLRKKTSHQETHASPEQDEGAAGTSPRARTNLPPAAAPATRVVSSEMDDDDNRVTSSPQGAALMAAKAARQQRVVGAPAAGSGSASALARRAMAQTPEMRAMSSPQGAALMQAKAARSRAAAGGMQGAVSPPALIPAPDSATSSQEEHDRAGAASSFQLEAATGADERSPPRDADASFLDLGAAAPAPTSSAAVDASVSASQTFRPVATVTAPATSGPVPAVPSPRGAMAYADIPSALHHGRVSSGGDASSSEASAAAIGNTAPLQPSPRRKASAAAPLSLPPHHVDAPGGVASPAGAPLSGGPSHVWVTSPGSMSSGDADSSSSQKRLVSHSGGGSTLISVSSSAPVVAGTAPVAATTSSSAQPSSQSSSLTMPDMRAASGGDGDADVSMELRDRSISLQTDGTDTDGVAGASPLTAARRLGGVPIATAHPAAESLLRSLSHPLVHSAQTSISGASTHGRMMMHHDSLASEGTQTSSGGAHVVSTSDGVTTQANMTVEPSPTMSDDSLTHIMEGSTAADARSEALLRYRQGSLVDAMLDEGAEEYTGDSSRSQPSVEAPPALHIHGPLEPIDEAPRETASVVPSEAAAPAPATSRFPESPHVMHSGRIMERLIAGQLQEEHSESPMGDMLLRRKARARDRSPAAPSSTLAYDTPTSSNTLSGSQQVAPEPQASVAAAVHAEAAPPPADSPPDEEKSVAATTAAVTAVSMVPATTVMAAALAPPVVPETAVAPPAVCATTPPVPAPAPQAAAAVTSLSSKSGSVASPPLKSPSAAARGPEEPFPVLQRVARGNTNDGVEEVARTRPSSAALSYATAVKTSPSASGVPPRGAAAHASPPASRLPPASPPASRVAPGTPPRSGGGKVDGPAWTASSALDALTAAASPPRTVAASTPGSAGSQSSAGARGRGGRRGSRNR